MLFRSSLRRRPPLRQDGETCWTEIQLHALASSPNDDALTPTKYEHRGA